MWDGSHHLAFPYYCHVMVQKNNNSNMRGPSIFLTVENVKKTQRSEDNDLRSGPTGSDIILNCLIEKSSR